MHESVRDWIGAKVRDLGLADRGALEVGSYDVNGGIRSLFTGEFTGVDVVDGPGVDLVVEQGGRLPFDDATFDVVVSTEMLEHDLRPWRTLAEMRRVAATGAPLLLTCRGYNESGSFPFHNPPDRWRYSDDALRALLEDAGWSVGSIEADGQAHGWFVGATAS